MNEEQFLNLKPMSYNTPKKASKILNAAKKIPQSDEVINKIKEIQAFAWNLGVKDYYQSPKNVVEQLILYAKSNNTYGNILEPSAGTGNIAEAIRNAYDYTLDNFDLDCVEINPVFANILREKDFNVYNEDFLRYNPEKDYGLVIMNPPFNDIINHIKKAVSVCHKDGFVFTIVPKDFHKMSRNKPFIDEYGLIVYDEKLSFKEVGINILCDIAEIDLRKINNFKLSLYTFFCNEEVDYPLYFFNNYLTGDYDRAIYEKCIKIPNPTNELLFKLFIDFCVTATSFSIGFCQKQIQPYLMFGSVLHKYYHECMGELFEFPAA